MEAIKTEYEGIVFDSKSEAVFARALHLAGCSFQHNWHWAGHKWDFLVSWEKSRMPPTLVEYKPKQPTLTYLANLRKLILAKPFDAFLVWGNPWDGPQDMGKPISNDCSYAGWPVYDRRYDPPDFDTPHGTWILDPPYIPGDASRDGEHGVFRLFGITEDIAQEAKKYRFDLQ